MRKSLGFLIMILAVVLAVVQAQAGVITLTFEGLQDQEPVDNFYNGGTGGKGSTGPNYGVSISSDSLAVISRTAGGSGYFDGAPTMSTVMYVLTRAGDTMNVANGFDTGLSFFYSSIFGPGSVQVYSDLNGTGTLLASLELPTTIADGPGCTQVYCPWMPFGVSFNGTAESVVFNGVPNRIGFDNIALGNDDPPGLPEPATLTLLGSGLLGLVFLARRRQ